MRISLRALAVAALLPLGACSALGPTDEAAFGPALTPVAYPTALVAKPAAGLSLVSAREVAAIPASANSLWRTGARAFFVDQRASRVGDILTVGIDIDDSAKTSNASNSQRTSGMSAGVPHFFGLESTLGKILPGAFDPSSTIETNSSQNNAGSGAVNRAEKISLTIAAVVTQILPNGNLVIQGTQEVRTNNDVRQLTVAGIVRPEDISAANTVKHSQIAEARISYSGRGDISRVQKTPMGQAVVEKLQIF